MAFSVYILKSENTKRYYVGQTKDLDKRIIRHNTRLVKSTKAGSPWKVIWSVKLPTRIKAVELEKRIKNRGAARFLIDLGIELTI